MIRQYFVDTSVIIDHVNGEPDAVKLLENVKGELVSSYICLAELLEGVHRHPNPKLARAGIEVFLNGLSYIYSVDKDVAEKFSEIRARLRRKGQLPGDMDLLIAATCLAYRLVLVTYNKKHFERVEGLEIYTPK